MAYINGYVNGYNNDTNTEELDNLFQNSLVEDKKKSLLDSVLAKRTELGFSTADVTGRFVEALDADTVKIHPSQRDYIENPNAQPFSVRLKSNSPIESYNSYELNHGNESDPKVAARLAKQRQAIEDDEILKGWFNPATNEDVYARGEKAKKLLQDKLNLVNQGKSTLSMALTGKQDKFKRELGDIKFNNELPISDQLNTPELNSSYNSQFNIGKRTRAGDNLEGMATDFLGTVASRFPTVMSNIGVGTVDTITGLQQYGYNKLGDLVGGDSGEVLKKIGNIAREPSNILHGRTHYLDDYINSLNISDAAKDTFKALKYDPNELDKITANLYESEALKQSRRDYEEIASKPEELRKALGHKANTLSEHLSDLGEDMFAVGEGFINHPRSMLTSDLPANLPQLLLPMGITGKAAESIAMKAAAKVGGIENGIITNAGKKAIAEEFANKATQDKLIALGALTEGTQAASSIVNQAEDAGRKFEDYALPAIAGGAITGLIGGASNKIFGTNAADMIRGVRGNSSIAKAIATEGFAEELPQSTNEAFATNYALGQDLWKDVGRQAAEGAILGGLIGGGMESPKATAESLRGLARKALTSNQSNQSPENASNQSEAFSNDLEHVSETIPNEDNNFELPEEAIDYYGIDPDKHKVAHDLVSDEQALKDRLTDIESKNNLMEEVDSLSIGTVGKKALIGLKAISDKFANDYVVSDEFSDPYIAQTTGLNTALLSEQDTHIAKRLADNNTDSLVADITSLNESLVEPRDDEDQVNEVVKLNKQLLSKFTESNLDTLSDVKTQELIKENLNRLRTIQEGNIPVITEDTSIEELGNILQNNLGSIKLTPAEEAIVSKKQAELASKPDKTKEEDQLLKRYELYKGTQQQLKSILKTGEEVNNEVINGGGNKLGANQWVDLIDANLQSNRPDLAKAALDTFTNWANYHAEKANQLSVVTRMLQSDKYKNLSMDELYAKAHKDKFDPLYQEFNKLNAIQAHGNSIEIDGEQDWRTTTGVNYQLVRKPSDTSSADMIGRFSNLTSQVNTESEYLNNRIAEANLKINGSTKPTKTKVNKKPRVYNLALDNLAKNFERRKGNEATKAQVSKNRKEAENAARKEKQEQEERKKNPIPESPPVKDDDKTRDMFSENEEEFNIVYEQNEKYQELKKLLFTKDITLYNVLLFISNNSNRLGKLAKHLLEIIPKDLKFIVNESKEDLGFGGTYINNNKTIYINPNIDFYTKDKNAFTKIMGTIIHETLHAITEDKIDSNPKIQDQLRAILNKLEEHAKDGWIIRTIGGKRYEYNTAWISNYPPITDIHEIITHGFTNYHLNMILNDIEGIGKVSLWDKFISAVSQLLGFSPKENSLLSNLIETYLEIVNEEVSSNEDQKEDIKEDTSDKDEKLSKLQKDIINLRNKIKDNYSDTRKEIQNNINELNSEIEELKNKIEELENNSTKDNDTFGSIKKNKKIGDRGTGEFVPTKATNEQLILTYNYQIDKLNEKLDKLNKKLDKLNEYHEENKKTLLSKYKEVQQLDSTVFDKIIFPSLLKDNNYNTATIEESGLELNEVQQQKLFVKENPIDKFDKDDSLISKAVQLTNKEFLTNIVSLGKSTLLNKYKNVIKNWYKIPELSNKLQTEEELYSLEIIQNFQEDFRKAFLNKIKLNNPFHDSIGYVLQENGTTPNENVIAAMALSSLAYLVQNTKSVYNTHDMIRSIFGKDEEFNVTDEMVELFSSVGKVLNHETPTLGSNIANLLGFKRKDEHKGKLLEAALGNMAFQTLIDMGLLNLHFIPENVMKAVSKEEEIPSQTKPDASNAHSFIKSGTYFISPSSQINDEGYPKVSDEIQEYIDAVKATKDILEDTLELDFFSSTFSTKEFTKEKVDKLLGNKWKNTFTDYTNSEKEVLLKYSNTKYTNQTRLAKLDLEENILKEIGLGYNLDTFILDVNEKSHKGSLIQVTRNIEEVNQAKKALRDVDGLYFFNELVKSGREQMTGGGQSNKYIRWFLVPEGSERTLTFDPKDENNFLFKIAVLASFGEKVHKKNINQLDTLFEERINSNQDMYELYKSSNGFKELTSEQQKTLRNRIYTLGEGYHSLAGLTELMAYMQAKENNDKSFSTTLLREDDGITNGPFIGYLLYGDFDGSEDNQKSLNSFAVSTTNHNFTYSDFANNSGLDSYELVKDEILNDTSIKNADKSLLNLLGNINRNFTKNPVTKNIFGANINNIAKAIGDHSIYGNAFYDGLYDFIQKKVNEIINTSDQKIKKELVNEIQDKIQHIDNVLHTKYVEQLFINEPISNLKENLKKFKLTKWQEKRLSRDIQELITKPLENAVIKYWGSVMENRQEFNNVYAIGNAVANKLLKEKINDIVESKFQEMESKGLLNSSFIVLTKADLAKVMEELKDILPHMEIPNFDKTSHKVYFWDTEKTPKYNNKFYIAQVKFKENKDKSFTAYYKNSSGQITKFNINKNIKSHAATISSLILDDISVRVPIGSIHNSDSIPIKDIMASMYKALLVHDGQNSPFTDTDEISYEMNKSMFNHIQRFNPYNSLLKYIDEINKYLDNSMDVAITAPGTLKDDVLQDRTDPKNIINMSASEKLTKVTTWAKEKAIAKDNSISQIKALGNYGGNFPFKPKVAEYVKTHLNDSIQDFIKEEFGDNENTISILTEEFTNRYLQPRQNTVDMVVNELGNITKKELNEKISNIEKSITTILNTEEEENSKPTQDSNQESNIFSVKNLFTVNPIQKADTKAISKASIATQFIGYGSGIPNSSTELYRQQAGQYANTGKYSSNDVIFVSVPGKRGNENIRHKQQSLTIKEAEKALLAGATLLTDNKEYTEKSNYNEGEKRLLKYFTNKGYFYSEININNEKIGVWNLNQESNKNTFGSIPGSSVFTGTPTELNSSNVESTLNELIANDDNPDTLKFTQVQDTPEHQSYLKDLMKNLVSKVIKPLEYYYNVDGDLTHGFFNMNAPDKLKVAVTIANKVNHSYSGIRMTGATTYAHELLHAVTGIALTDPNNFHLYREVVKLFNHVKANLTPEQLAKYEYVFLNDENERKTYTDTKGLSHEHIYNHGILEFIAYAKSEPELIKIIDSIPDMKIERFKDLPLGHMVTDLINRVFDWFEKAILHKGTSTKARIDAITITLAYAHEKRKPSIISKIQIPQEWNEEVNKLRDKVIIEPLKDLNKLINKKTSNSFVKDVTSTIDNMTHLKWKEINTWIRTMTGIKNQLNDDLVKSVISEIAGNTPDTNKFHKQVSIRAILRDHVVNKILEVVSQFLNNQTSRKLTKQEKKALTKVGIKGSLSDLNMSLDQFNTLLTNDEALQDEIRNTKDMLVGSQYQRYWNNQARNLASYMINNTFIKGEEINAHNVHLIVNNLKWYDSKADIPDNIIEVLTKLSRLYTITFMDKEDKASFSKLIQEEPNVVQATLDGHALYKKDYLERILKDNSLLVMDGTIHEAINPSTVLTIASMKEGKELVKQGYYDNPIKLKKSPADNTDSELYIWFADSKMLQTYQQSGTSFTELQDSLSNFMSGYTSSEGTKNIMSKLGSSAVPRNAMRQAITNSIARTNRNNPEEQASFTPKYNHAGRMVGFTYLLNEKVKDKYLERAMDYDYVLSSMMANIEDQLASKPINEKMVDALLLDKKEFARYPKLFVEIGPNSKKKEHQDIWFRLPTATREYIKEKTGQEFISVRKEVLDTVFGYRQLSITNWIRPYTVDELKNHKHIKQLGEWIFNHLGPNNPIMNMRNLRKFEAGWQEAIKMAKDTIVIKLPKTLIANEVSNSATLLTRSIPFNFISKEKSEVFKNMSLYFKTTKEISELEYMIQVKPSLNTKESQVKLDQLKTLQNMNPVHELIEEGKFQTIVEDITANEGLWNWKSKYEDKLIAMGEKLPKVVKETGKFIALTHDTKMYKFLHNATMMSDLSARYVLHKWNMQNGMSKEESLQDITEAFVNYEIPTHRFIEYGNEMGFLMFTKYFFRILKPMAKETLKNPVNVLALNLLQMFYTFENIHNIDITDFFNKVNNPFGSVFSIIDANPFYDAMK
jgi:hypothetical protein